MYFPEAIPLRMSCLAMAACHGSSVSEHRVKGAAPRWRGEADSTRGEFMDLI